MNGRFPGPIKAHLINDIFKYLGITDQDCLMCELDRSIDRYGICDPFAWWMKQSGLADADTTHHTSYKFTIK